MFHHHPERLGKYLRTQFIHGYWRFRLYRKHPEYVSGDDYTRAGDVAETLLAGLVPAGLGVSLGVPAWLGLPVLVPLGALMALETVRAFRIACPVRDWVLWPTGTFVFAVRSFCRVAGLAWGAARSAAGNSGRRSSVRR